MSRSREGDERMRRLTLIFLIISSAAANPAAGILREMVLIM